MSWLRLPLLYLRIGAQNEMQYRVNFFIQLLQSLIGLAVGLIGQFVVFSHTPTLHGWTQPELLVVLGVFVIMGGIIQALIQPNMQMLMDDVRQGTLDYALTKPADSQLLVSVRTFSLWQLVNVLVGSVLLVVAVVLLGDSIGWLDALEFAGTLVLGGIMIYCFWLIITTCAFWIVRMDNVIELFQGFYQAGRWPVSIYPGWLQSGLTFLVPIAFAVTIPAEALTHRLTPLMLLGAFGMTLGLLIVTRLFWRWGLRHYGSASS